VPIPRLETTQFPQQFSESEPSKNRRFGTG
jgi:hypothetical protein